MEAKLDEGRLLAQFDRLIEQGMVFFNQDYRTVPVSDQGFAVRPLPDNFKPIQLLTSL